MRTDSAHNSHRSASPISATTASALLALLAIAMTVSAQGATAVGLPETLAGSRPMLRDTSAAREFAAAVTAAVRDLVRHDTIDSSAACDFPTLATIASTSAASEFVFEDVGRSHAPPLAKRLLNIPPPTN